MWDTFNDNDNSRMARKNEIKFENLDGISMEMGIKFDELIGKILPSIGNAFTFDRKRCGHSESNFQIFYETARSLIIPIDRESVLLSVPVVNTLGVTQAEDL